MRRPAIAVSHGVYPRCGAASCAQAFRVTTAERRSAFSGGTGWVRAMRRGAAPFNGERRAMLDR